LILVESFPWEKIECDVEFWCASITSWTNWVHNARIKYLSFHSLGIGEGGLQLQPIFGMGKRIITGGWELGLAVMLLIHLEVRWQGNSNSRSGRP
jgi:hypothetical protein